MADFMIDCNDTEFWFLITCMKDLISKKIVPRKKFIIVDGLIGAGKTTLIEFDAEEIEEEASALPGFGIMAAGASLVFVSRRFRS